MKRTIGFTVVLALFGMASARAQEPGALIEKLKSKDADVADNAREDLLKLGAAAIEPLRKASSESPDAAFKKTAASLADRLEIRRAAAGLAEAWGDRWYSGFIGELKVGWAHLKAEEKDGKIVLDDEIRLQQNKDTVFHIKAVLTCRPNEYLSVESLTLDLASPEHSVTATAQVKENRLVVKANGETKASKIRSNTVVDLAVFPLVTLLPKTEGYEVEVLELIKPKLPEAAVLKFDKEETIEFEERKVKTRRFMQSSGSGKDRFYYVDAAGRLLRVQLMAEDDKDVELILSDEKRAKDIDTKD